MLTETLSHDQYPIRRGPADEQFPRQLCSARAWTGEQRDLRVRAADMGGVPKVSPVAITVRTDDERVVPRDPSARECRRDRGDRRNHRDGFETRIPQRPQHAEEPWIARREHRGRPGVRGQRVDRRRERAERDRGRSSVYRRAANSNSDGLAAIIAIAATVSTQSERVQMPRTSDDEGRRVERRACGR